MKKLLLSFFVLVVFALMTNVFGQVAGDYGTYQAAQVWGNSSNTSITWLVFNTLPDWSDATTTTTQPSSSSNTNIWVRNGHTLTIPASGTSYCFDLHVESGGSVASLNTAGNPRYMRVYGDIFNEGTIGGPNDGLSLQPYAATCTISGSGITYLGRIQPNNLAVHIIFATNVTLVYGSGTGSAQMYCNGRDLTVTINANKTLYFNPYTGLLGYFSVGTSGSNDPGTGQNLTVNVYGTLSLADGVQFNLRNTAAYTSTLNVFSGGIVNCGSSLWAPTVGAGTANVTVSAGGQVNFNGTIATCDISKATTTVNGTLDFGTSAIAIRDIGTATVGSTGLLRFQDGTYPTGSVTLNSGSTAEYYGSSPITLGASPTAYSNLLVSNSAGVTLGAALAVSNLFSIVSGASIDLGSFTHTTEYLKLAGVDQSPGTHGSTASTATYQNSTYFGSSATGLLIVNAALPVELASFNANAKNGLVQLSWRTISETNSLMFDVQRKSENSEWTKIGEVIAAGNSNSPKDYTFADSKLTSGKYQYRLKMIDVDGSYQYSNIVNAEISLPAEFSLSQNYPNPFNPSTTISYQLAANSFVTLKVYDVLGNEIATLVNEQQETGFYRLPFTTSEKQLANGMYIYKIQAGNFTQTKKMLLIK